MSDRCNRCGEVPNPDGQCACPKHPAASSLAAQIGSSDSLIAAIEGNYAGMSHGDLVLTCRMLESGRAAWRKDAERYETILRRVLEWCETENPNFEIDADAIRAALNPPND